MFADIPRAGIDPVDTPDRAMMIIASALEVPLRSETIAVVLDADDTGIAVIVVDGTDSPDDLFEVAELIGQTAPIHHGRRVVIASVRPGGDVLDDDVFRWHIATDELNDCDIELIDWFVLTDLDLPPVCPRALGLLPSRWTGAAGSG